MRKALNQLNFLLDKKQKKGLLWLLIGAVFVSALDTLIVAMIAPFMSLIMDPTSRANNLLVQIVSRFFSIDSTKKLVVLFSMFFIALYLLRGAAKLLYNYLQARILALYRMQLSIRLFSFVIHKPYAYHLKHNTAETLRLVNTDVANVFSLINCLMQTMACGLVAIGVVLVLVVLDWKLTVLLLCIAYLFIFLMKQHLKRFIQKMANISFMASSEMNKWVNQAIGGLKVVLVERSQQYYEAHYGKAAKNAAVSNSNYVAVDGLPKILIDTLFMVIVFSFILLQEMLGNDILSDFPTLASFAVAALRLIPVFGQITATLNTAAYYRPSLDAIDEALHTGEIEREAIARIERLETKNAMDEPPMCLEQELRLSHVSFRYEDAQTDLLHDLNLVIPAKKSVALIGTTGSGKSTLADIILGLHRPTQGSVLVDGQDIRQNPVGWARLVGYIPQFIYLCDDTIRANIALGEEQDQVDDDWVWNCLERAQLKEVVQQFPDSLDTVTGENGIRLSGGQRQRIGIARALYCRPQFLLMDEATSALDTETEQAIVDSIEQLSGDLTILVIAHRPSAIEKCDIVYKVENGKALQVR